MVPFCFARCLPSTGAVVSRRVSTVKGSNHAAVRTLLLLRSIFSSLPARFDLRQLIRCQVVEEPALGSVDHSAKI
jgi:hypothetical protein